MTTPNPKPPGPVKQAARTLSLGLALGVASFIIGMPLAGKALALLPDSPDSGPGPLLFVAALLLFNLPALLVAPGLAYVAGQFLDLKPASIGVTMMVMLQGFLFAVTFITSGADEITLLALVQFIVVFAVGAFLCTVAYRKAQHRAVRTEEEERRQAAASHRLASLQFNPDTSAPAPGPAATLPAVDAAAAESPRQPAPATPSQVAAVAAEEPPAAGEPPPAVGKTAASG